MNREEASQSLSIDETWSGHVAIEHWSYAKWSRSHRALTIREEAMELLVIDHTRRAHVDGEHWRSIRGEATQGCAVNWEGRVSTRTGDIDRAVSNSEKNANLRVPVMAARGSNLTESESENQWLSDLQVEKRKIILSQLRHTRLPWVRGCDLGRHEGLS